MPANGCAHRHPLPEQAAVITLGGDADVAGIEVWVEPLGEAASAEVVIVDVDEARVVDRQALAYLLGIFDHPGRPGHVCSRCYRTFDRSASASPRRALDAHRFPEWNQSATM